MGNAVEVAAQVRIDHLRIASIQQVLDRSHRILRIASGPISVLLRLQIGLEYRFEDQHCGHLHHAVADRGYPQRPLFTVRLRDPHAPDRLGSIRLCFQVSCQFLQPPLRSVFLDGREGLGIHSRCSAIGSTAFVGMAQDIGTVHLVVQSVEAIGWSLFRFGM